jgi:hypothetical protein
MVGRTHPTLFSLFVMLSVAKHDLAVRDSSVAYGPLKMTEKLTSLYPVWLT